ncbi:unnamed protein product [Lampetra fluviatilis]
MMNLSEVPAANHLTSDQSRGFCSRVPPDTLFFLPRPFPFAIRTALAILKAEWPLGGTEQLPVRVGRGVRGGVRLPVASHPPARYAPNEAPISGGLEYSRVLPVYFTADTAVLSEGSLICRCLLCGYQTSCTRVPTQYPQAGGTHLLFKVTDTFAPFRRATGAWAGGVVARRGGGRWPRVNTERQPREGTRPGGRLPEAMERFRELVRVAAHAGRLPEAARSSCQSQRGPPAEGIETGDQRVLPAELFQPL